MKRIPLIMSMATAAVTVTLLTGCSIHPHQLASAPTAAAVASSAPIPSVVGQTGDAAKKALEGAGLVVKWDAGADFVILPSHWMVVSQLPAAGTSAPAGSIVTLTVTKSAGDSTRAAPAQPSVPIEYKNALSKATSYANLMHMSKQGVYDQLTSQYGEQFAPEAAQYAVDNVKADWNANALAKAKDYETQMAMSPAAIHDQLTSQYGEKFTAAEADYAIAHLND